VTVVAAAAAASSFLTLRAQRFFKGYICKPSSEEVKLF
jgi:hypothetical protein